MAEEKKYLFTLNIRKSSGVKLFGEKGKLINIANKKVHLTKDEAIQNYMFIKKEIIIPADTTGTQLIQNKEFLESVKSYASERLNNIVSVEKNNEKIKTVEENYKKKISGLEKEISEKDKKILILNKEIKTLKTAQAKLEDELKSK